MFEVVGIYKTELVNTKMPLIISLIIISITLIFMLIINSVFNLELFLFTSYSKGILETVLSFQLFFWLIDFGVFRFIEEFSKLK